MYSLSAVDSGLQLAPVLQRVREDPVDAAQRRQQTKGNALLITQRLEQLRPGVDHQLSALGATGCRCVLDHWPGQLHCGNLGSCLPHWWRAVQCYVLVSVILMGSGVLVCWVCWRVWMGIPQMRLCNAAAATMTSVAHP